MSTLERLTPFHVILTTPPGGLCRYLCPADLAALAAINSCAQKILSLISKDTEVREKVFKNQLIKLENDDDLFTYMESICCNRFIFKGMLNIISFERIYHLWTKSLMTPSLITESLLASKKAKIIEVNLNWDFPDVTTANNPKAIQAILNSSYGDAITGENLRRALGSASFQIKQRTLFETILTSQYTNKISGACLGYCLYTSLRYHPRKIYQAFLDSCNPNESLSQILGQILQEASRSGDCAMVQEVLDYPHAEEISTEDLISAVRSAVGLSTSAQQSSCIQTILNSWHAEKIPVEKLMNAMCSACLPPHISDLKNIRITYPQFVLNSPLVYKLSISAFYVNFTDALFDSAYRISSFIHTSRLFILLGIFACYDIMILSQTQEMLSSSFLPTRLFGLLNCAAQFYMTSSFWKIRWIVVSEIFDRFKKETKSRGSCKTSSVGQIR
jgi:hypothetical protein